MTNQAQCNIEGHVFLGRQPPFVGSTQAAIRELPAGSYVCKKCKVVLQIGKVT